MFGALVGAAVKLEHERPFNPGSVFQFNWYFIAAGAISLASVTRKAQQLSFSSLASFANAAIQATTQLSGD